MMVRDDHPGSHGESPVDAFHGRAAGVDGEQEVALLQDAVHPGGEQAVVLDGPVGNDRYDFETELPEHGFADIDAGNAVHVVMSVENDLPAAVAERGKLELENLQLREHGPPAGFWGLPLRNGVGGTGEALPEHIQRLNSQKSLRPGPVLFYPPPVVIVATIIQESLLTYIRESFVAGRRVVNPCAIGGSSGHLQQSALM